MVDIPGVWTGYNNPCPISFKEIMRLLLLVILFPSTLSAQLEIGPQLSLSSTDRLREWQGGLGVALEAPLSDDLRLIGTLLSTLPLQKNFKEYRGDPRQLAVGDTTRRYVEGVQWLMRQQIGAGIATNMHRTRSGLEFEVGLLTGVHWQVRGSNSDVIVIWSGERYHEQHRDRRSYPFISPVIGLRADAGRNRFCADLRTVLLIGRPGDAIGPEGALFMLNVGYLWPLKNS
jgi:hypothetical protein